MPYPNEHAARITNPDKYDNFARKNISNGIDIILGIKDGKSETQAYRFDKSVYTVDEAKKWLRDNKISPISFEPATEKKEMESQDYCNETKKFIKETFETVKDIFSTGTWNGDEYIDSDLEDMVKNFNYLKESDPNFKDGIPLKVDLFKDTKPENARHGGCPAAGWITELKKIGNKIYAHIEKIPKVVKELIETKAYKQVSAEMVWNMKQKGLPENTRLKRVLTGVALLGIEHPGVTNLEGFSKLYQAQDDEILKIYIVEKEKEETKVKKEAQNNTKEAVKMDLEIKKEYEDKVAKLENDLKESKEQLKKFETEKVEAEKKLKEIEKNKVENEIKMFVEKQEADGKILPKHKAEVIAIFNSLDDSRKVNFQSGEKIESISLIKLFERYIESLPKLIEFKEKAEGAALKDSNEPEYLKNFQAKPEDDFGSVYEQKLAYAAKMYAEKNKVDYKTSLLEVAKLIKE